MSVRKSKLTVEQVLEARLRYAAGERELTKLASDYGVSRHTITNAILSYTFKHLPMPPRTC
jgi:hypothetical protein